MTSPPEFSVRWLPPARLDRGLARVALALALLYLLLLDLRPYPGDVVVKTAFCLLLVMVAWRADNRLLSLALMFAAAGDFFLGFDPVGLFVPGLASFLVTHVLYIAVFIRHIRVHGTTRVRWRIAAMGVAAIYIVVVGTAIFANLGPLLVPVAAYMAAITVMVMTALKVRPLGVPVGALLFLVSDSLIALDKFHHPDLWYGPAIWASYAAAQLAIVHGLIVARPHLAG